MLGAGEAVRKVGLQLLGTVCLWGGREKKKRSQRIQGFASEKRADRFLLGDMAFRWSQTARAHWVLGDTTVPGLAPTPSETCQSRWTHHITVRAVPPGTFLDELLLLQSKVLPFYNLWKLKSTKKQREKQGTMTHM